MGCYLRRMTLRSAFGAAFALLTLLVACSSGDDAASSRPSSSAAATPHADTDSDTDAASCLLRATDYDRTCTQDSDCVLVPKGGNVCDPCSNATGCLFCDFDALSASGAATYNAALSAVRPAPSTEGSAACWFGSCAISGDGGGAPVCLSGSCSVPAWTAYACP